MAENEKTTAAEYLLKAEKSRDNRLKYDFMPSMLEIIEKPANKVGTIIIYTIFTLVAVAILWACLSRVDVVVTASGTIMPQGKLSIVQTASGGTISSINVREGDYVNAGAVLIEMNTDSLSIDIDKLYVERQILKDEIDIYSKVLLGVELQYLTVDSYDGESKNAVMGIVNSDISYHSELDVLEGELETAKLNKEMADIQLEEYKSSGTSRQRESQELKIKQSELAVTEAELKIDNAKSKYITGINQQLSELRTKLAETEANIEKYELAESGQMITAPVSGYVNSIDVNTIGQYTAAGTQLITIVPDGATLEMNCYVKNMDIADIETGMDVQIKLEAYPYNRYGTVNGKVSYISPSSFTNEEMGSVYLVKVQLTDVPEDINVISGLTGSLEIKTGTRSVMSYFLEPITQGLGNSMKEK